MRNGIAMNLVSFSIRTKGLQNFARRLWTVFTRFGFSERRSRRALYTIIDALRPYQAAPTFFIPAVVLRRHTGLLRGIAHEGAEVGVHGYVHNDYRALDTNEQASQTRQAATLFKTVDMPYRGFRNPYLGWTEHALQVFTQCGFQYESNEAVSHEVIDAASLTPLQKSGYEKSLALFQAVPCTTWALRPHFEGELLRIPLSIPDDEMAFDRLRITDPREVGRIWSEIMRRVYARGGLYTLNLHPERGILCKQALGDLLSTAWSFPLPVWIARLDDIAQWWQERRSFVWQITPLEPHRWLVRATGTSRATLLARCLTVEYALAESWHATDEVVRAHRFTVQAASCPCLGLSSRTPQEVVDFLHEQGYPTLACPPDSASSFADYIDKPEGLGATREERARICSELVERIERLDAPLLRFGCWPDGSRAALSITGDIDSVTIQDFFLRILEVSSPGDRKGVH
jgi:peptidoglycan/xylan/chitin deacetylase (PgdA/CDA1 family)